MHFEVGVIIIWNEKSLKQTQKLLWIREQKRNGDWFTLGSFHLSSAVIAIFEFSIASGILSLNHFQNFLQVTYTKYTLAVQKQMCWIKWEFTVLTSSQLIIFFSLVTKNGEGIIFHGFGW